MPSVIRVPLAAFPGAARLVTRLVTRLALVVVLVVAVLVLAISAPARAENPKPYSGTIVYGTGKPFLPFVDAFRDSIKANGFTIVGLACATCAAKSRGVTIPGNRVFLFFRPDYAVRMLAASTAAGIEAPIRVYVTERDDGTAEVTYRQPSHVFGAYDLPELDELGADLDAAVAKILAEALG